MRRGMRWADVCRVHDGRGALTHRIRLAPCREALHRLQVEGPGFDTTAELAKAAASDRRTISRFFSGGPVGIGVARKIVEVLGLRLEDVAIPVIDRAEATRPA